MHSNWIIHFIKRNKLRSQVINCNEFIKPYITLDFEIYVTGSSGDIIMYMFMCIQGARVVFHYTGLKVVKFNIFLTENFRKLTNFFDRTSHTCLFWAFFFSLYTLFLSSGFSVNVSNHFMQVLQSMQSPKWNPLWCFVNTVRF